MVVYVIVIILASVLAVTAESMWNRGRGQTLPRKGNVWAVAVSTLLIGVSALRWEVGADYLAYERAFPRYVAQALEEFHILGEPGIRIIAWLSFQLGYGSELMFALAAAITIALSIRTLWRWSPAFGFAVGIYLLAGAWYGSFNGVRQYLAASILFAGHRYIIKRQFLKWAAVVLLALLFHVSAVIGLLFYFIPTKRTSFKYQAALIAIGIVFMLGMGALLDFLEVFTGDSDRWGGSYSQTTINPLRIAFAFVPILIFWLLSARQTIAESQGWFYINMLAIYAASYLASLNSAMVARFTIYPLVFLSIGLVYSTNLSNRRERSIMRIFLVALYGVFMAVEISNTSSLNNFKWIFDNQNV